MEEKKSSGVKGITWRKDKKKWIVRTTINGEIKNFGCYESLSKAKKVLKKATGDLLIKVKKKDPYRIREVKEAKEYIKNQRIRGIKYLNKKDVFEVFVKLPGELDFTGCFFSSSESFKKYYLFKEYQYFLKRPRRGIEFDRSNECWISFITIKGEQKEVGKFNYYYDALDATVQAEVENPNFDR